MMKLRKAYDFSGRVPFATDPVSLTHQSMAPECDINRVMERWQKTGVLEHRNTFEGQYGDFTDTPSDYHASMNAVVRAEEMFSSLPSSIRKRFANDPGNFLDFVGDPENHSELIKMGLANAVDKPEVVDKNDKPNDDKKPNPPSSAKTSSEPKNPQD